MSGRDEKPVQLFLNHQPNLHSVLKERFVRVILTFGGTTRLTITNVKRWLSVQPQIRLFLEHQRLDEINMFLSGALEQEIVTERNGLLYAGRNIDEWSRRDAYNELNLSRM